MISAIILAAGQSKRMGQPKMLLPWGNVTVIGQVISVFANAGIKNILVITGREHEQIEEVILRYSQGYAVQSVYNPEYQNGEMLSSIKCGLRYLTQQVSGAAMIGLGDQPQVEERSVRMVHDAFLFTSSQLVVPSFEIRRGHPWLIARSLWNEVLQMSLEQTPREFLRAHAEDIHYVNVGSPSILADVDTPEDYYKSRP